jgi:hypothetical protein
MQPLRDSVGGVRPPVTSCVKRPIPMHALNEIVATRWACRLSRVASPRHQAVNADVTPRLSAKLGRRDLPQLVASIRYGSSTRRGLV